MMKYIDCELSDNFESQGWDHRKSAPLFRAWTRWKGTKAVPNFPIVRLEHYFPEIDDPQIIQLAMNEFSHEFDKDALKITKLEEYCSHYCYTRSIILKP